jgi:hypothetical protein
MSVNYNFDLLKDADVVGMRYGLGGRYRDGKREFDRPVGN